MILLLITEMVTEMAKIAITRMDLMFTTITGSIDNAYVM